MKVLWLCNIVLPEFSQEFSLNRSTVGGWMTGMLHALGKIGGGREGLDIRLVFPIFDKKRLRDGYCNGYEYYTFLCDITHYNIDTIKKFEVILEKIRPDIVHIWGTECPHTLAMLTACEKLGILNRVVINIQGLVSVYAKHYVTGMPEKYINLKNEKGESVRDGQEMFEKRGIYEIESIKKVQHVIGRTDWDRACVEAINPSVCYHFCNEILRPAFYEFAGSWNYEKCEKYTIFVSQASYPIKGFHFLLKGLSVILQKYPDTKVYVAGSDILYKEEKTAYAIYLEELIEELGEAVKNAVVFTGRLDEKEMVERYRKAHIFVSASTVENESNSLSEARLIGVPTISSFVGGAYQRITTGEDGFLYPHDRIDLLVHYVCQLFENKHDICKKISDNAVRKISSFVEVNENANRNLMIYKEIIKSDR